MYRRIFLFLIGLPMAFFAGTAPAQTILKSRLKDLRPITLHAGANSIPTFAADGRAALVTQGWRDNGNAWGFNVYQVMLPTKVGGSDWNVVTLGKRMETQISDQPHTGEDALASVRLAHGKLDGRAETLLITATRDVAPQGGVPEASSTMIEVQVLRKNRDEEPGQARDYFEPAISFKTTKLYCHSDMALKQELGLALPKGYEGGGTADGC